MACEWSKQTKNDSIQNFDDEIDEKGCPSNKKFQITQDKNSGLLA